MSLPNQFFRSKHLEQRYKVSRSTIWKWEKEGVLPPAIRLGPRAKGWTENSINEHEASLGVPQAGVKEGLE